MRKITTLLTLLLTCLTGAMAQSNPPFDLSTESSPKWYYIKVNSKYYIKGNTCKQESVDANDATYKFAFIGDNYNDFVLKCGNGQYIDVNTNSHTTNGYSLASSLSDTEKSSFAVEEVDFSQGTFRLYHDSEKDPGRNMYLGRLYNSDFPDGLVIWTTLGSEDDGIMTIEEVPEIVTLTLNYTAWEGEAPFTVTKEIAKGTEVTASDIELGYYSGFGADVTLPFTITGNKTINVTCTPNFPFTVGKVYTLKDAHNNKTFTYVDDSNIEMSGTPDLKNSSFLFEHVAGTQNKFQLYSFGGKGYVTMSTINSSSSVYEHATISSDPVVWASGSTSPTSQYLVKPYNGYNQPSWTSFRLVHPGNSQAALSGRSGSYLNTWNSSSTSSWEYAALGVDEVDLVHIAEVPDLEYIQPYTIATSSLAPDVVQSLLSNLTKANIQTLLDNMGAQTTFSDFGDLVDLNTIYQLEFVRQSARMGVYTDIATTANLTESDTYYSSTTNASADANGNVITSPQQVVTTAPTSLWSDNTHFMGSLWQFEKKADGQYYARNVNSGLYISGGKDKLKLHFATAKSEGHYFVMESGGGDVWAMREPQTTYSGREYLNNTYNPGGNNNRTTVGYYKDGTSDLGNQIRFKKVTAIPLSVSAAGWTAFCFPVKVTVPDGVTVYQATSSNGESLHLEEVAAGTVLPAGAGFLCEAAEGTYNFGITAADAADFSSNLLTGATLRRTGMTPNNFYALGNKNGVGFYRVNSETVPANKPFLPASALTSSVREMLSFDFGMATGISNTQNADRTDTNVLYDLNGRRVYYPVRGIYVNGRGEKIFLNK